MIGKDQPDLRINGVFFSLCLIVFINLLVLSGMLMLASPTLNPAAFGSAWLQAARSSSEAIREIFLLLRSLIS
jgi:cytochrome b561